MTDLELEYVRYRSGVENARFMQQHADDLIGPTAEEEALEDLPLGGLTTPFTKGLAALGEKVKEAAQAVRPGLDVAGKALGLSLPEGGMGKALEHTVLGAPTEQMSPTETGVSALLAIPPLVGLSQAVKDALRLEYYSAKRGLSAVEPTLLEGEQGLPKAYAYPPGVKPSARKEGDVYKYELHVPANRIADPDTYRDYAEKFPDLAARERALKEKGYLGYRAPDSDAVVLLDKHDLVHARRPPKPLTPKHLRTLSQLTMRDLLDTGGSTVSVSLGNLRGTNAYSVAAFPEHRAYLTGYPRLHDIQQWIERISREVDLNDEMIALGSWHDTENNRIELSLSIIFHNLDDAMAYARALGERYIYSLGSGHTIPVEGAVGLGEAGRIDVYAALSLASALAGGAYGWHAADPEDDRVLEALKGAGLGALLPAAIPMAKTLARRHTRHSASMGAAALTPDERATPLADLAKQYHEDVARYQRGVITHQASREMGASLQASGLVSDEWIATRYPGVPYNAEQAAVLRDYLRQEGEKLQALAKAYNADPTPEREREFLRQLATYAKLDPLYVGLKAEAGRLLSFLNDTENEINTFVQQLSGVVGKVRAVQSPKRMAEMIAATKSVEQLADFARITTHPGLYDMFIEAWINGLLSQPITHATNVLSTALSLASSVPERALAARFRSPEGVVSGEASALLKAYFTSIADAWTVAARAFRTETPQLGATKQEARTHAITLSNFNRLLERLGINPLQGAWAAGIDYLGMAARIPGRLLMTADEFFKAIAFNGEKAAVAWREATREAVAEGLEGEALHRYVNKRYHEIVNDPNKWEAFRHDAEQFASYVTFTQDLGKYGQAAQVLASHPLGRIIIPFVRVPINIAKYAGERTPFALLSKAVRDDLAAGGVRRDLALAKMGLGTSILAVASLLAYSGVLTGFGPKDRETRLLWQSDKRMPYSINVSGLRRLAQGKDPAPQTGDHWVSINRADYVGMLLGAAADYTDIAVNLDDPKVQEELAARLALVSSHVLASKNYVKGVAEWMFAVVDPEHYGGRLEETLSRTLVTSVPVAGPAAKFIQRLLDPVVRETNGVMDSIRASIPGFSSTLPARVNYWGETVMREGWMWEQALSPLYRSTHYKDPVVEKLVESGVNLSQPRDTIGRVKLDPHQYEYLLRRFGDVRGPGGKTLYEAYADILDKLWERTPESARRDPQSILHLMLKRTEDVYKQLARQELYRKYPELRRLTGEDEVRARMESRKLLPPKELSKELSVGVE